MTFDSALTLHQKRHHVPNFDPEMKNNITNILFSPFIDDVRKTSWYINTSEELPDIPNYPDKEEDFAYFEIHKYMRRLKDLKICGKNIISMELFMLYPDGGTVSIQKYTERLIQLLCCEIIDLPWSMSISLRDSIPLYNFDDGVKIILKVEQKNNKPGSLSIYADFFRISEYDKHYSVNSERTKTQFEILEYSETENMLAGDVVYGLRVIDISNENIMFSHGKETILNCPERLLESKYPLATWTTYDLDEKDVHRSGIMWSESLSINRKVLWLRGRIIKV